MVLVLVVVVVVTLVVLNANNPHFPQRVASIRKYAVNLSNMVSAYFMKARTIKSEIYSTTTTLPPSPPRPPFARFELSLKLNERNRIEAIRYLALY